MFYKDPATGKFISKEVYEQNERFKLIMQDANEKEERARKIAKDIERRRLFKKERIYAQLQWGLWMIAWMGIVIAVFLVVDSWQMSVAWHSVDSFSIATAMWLGVSYIYAGYFKDMRKIRTILLQGVSNGSNPTKA